ncbi:heterokaryon incompatibility protein-domain-containing protein [Xylaria arbuscula]|nr:heterokaryon incompatibility protein-domain-containing protein [Xylaria arbuscula]
MTNFQPPYKSPCRTASQPDDGLSAEEKAQPNDSVVIAPPCSNNENDRAALVEGIIEPLCASCRSFRLDKYIEEGPPDPCKIVARIEPGWADDGCALCVIFTDILEEIGSSPIWHGQKVRHEQKLGVAELNVHVYRETGWGPHRVYLNIFETGFRYMGRFYLLQKSFTNSGGIPDDFGQDAGANSPDLPHVKQWLDNCRNSHSAVRSPCTPLRIPPRAPLRVIDCHTRMVRLARSNELYICLSYVWGKENTSSSFDGTALHSDLPRTIEDAISVAIELGIPQLWVDQYCINQGDAEEKMKTIQEMNLIYGGAELTIIAASGEDASAGLPGIRETPRQTRRLVRSGDYTFWMSKDMFMSFKNSRWNTRGWTYQEGLLSPRRLVFTDACLYGQCGQGYYIEALSSEIEDGSFERGTWPPLFPPGSTGPDDKYFFHERLTTYFPRNLSYGSDSLNAFQGVLSVYQSNDEEPSHRRTHFHGIPIMYNEGNPGSAMAFFLSGLAWRVDHIVTQECEEPSRPEASVSFPSWSWASYKASHPNAMERLVLDYMPHGLFYLEDIDVTICCQGAERISIKEFVLLSSIERDASNYLPSIYITSWTMENQISVDLFDVS